VEKPGIVEIPLIMGINQLIIINVWGHAYYLDYRNLRIDYGNAMIDKLINWEFASDNAGLFQ
jgi:superoxide dismutase, Fe-Mn family